MTIDRTVSRTRSQILQQRAERYFPGGVNSPVRAFGTVGGAPLFIRRARGVKRTLVWFAADPTRQVVDKEAGDGLASAVRSSHNGIPSPFALPASACFSLGPLHRGLLIVPEV